MNTLHTCRLGEWERRWSDVMRCFLESSRVSTSDTNRVSRAVDGSDRLTLRICRSASKQTTTVRCTWDCIDRSGSMYTPRLRTVDDGEMVSDPTLIEVWPSLVKIGQPKLHAMKNNDWSIESTDDRWPALSQIWAFKNYIQPFEFTKTSLTAVSVILNTVEYNSSRRLTYKVLTHKSRDQGIKGMINWSELLQEVKHGTFNQSINHALTFMWYLQSFMFGRLLSNKDKWILDYDFTYLTGRLLDYLHLLNLHISDNDPRFTSLSICNPLYPI